MTTVKGAAAEMVCPNCGEAEPPAGQLIVMVGAGGSAGAAVVGALDVVVGVLDVDREPVVAADTRCVLGDEPVVGAATNDSEDAGSA